MPSGPGRGNCWAAAHDYLLVPSTVRSGVRRGRRLAGAACAVGLAALGAVLGTVLAAQPAWAHSQTLPDSGLYSSRVTSITPPVQGLTIDLVRNGESVTLTNHTGKTVVVLGYTGEQYLRITPTGVEENVNSLSSFLNGSLVIQGLPQQLASNAQQKTPLWKHVSDTPAFTWHDHRIHWMSDQRPPVVAADPRNPHHVFDWSMAMTVGGDPVTVKGTLDWVGAPPLSAVQIELLVLGVVLVVVAVGLVIVRRRMARQREASPPERHVETAGAG